MMWKGHKRARFAALWATLIVGVFASWMAHTDAQEPEPVLVPEITANIDSVENPPATEVEPSPAESSVTPEQRRAWLDDWNNYWLNYEPPIAADSKSAKGTVILPDQAMFDEMAAEVAAQNDPNAIHRKIYAHFLDDPKNQKVVLFCAVCTILIAIGIRLIIRRRMALKRQRNNPTEGRNNKS